MFVFTKTLSHVLVPAAFALGVATAVQPAPAAASQTESASQKTTVAGSGSARFDWLAGGQEVADASGTVLTRVAAQGSGSWVCSPAGFGKHSRCYRR
ncbi:hypothetical protein [Celeribacter sp. ULVN23_4]